jgi:hypothetical protein
MEFDPAFTASEVKTWLEKNSFDVETIEKIAGNFTCKLYASRNSSSDCMLLQLLLMYSFASFFQMMKLLTVRTFMEFLGTNRKCDSTFQSSKREDFLRKRSERLWMPAWKCR